MIFAACCYCDHDMSYGIPDGAKLPAVVVRKCEGCGRANVFRASRVDPCGWTLEEGVAEYAADPDAVAFIRQRAAELGCSNV